VSQIYAYIHTHKYLHIIFLASFHNILCHPHIDKYAINEGKYYIAVAFWQYFQYLWRSNHCHRCLQIAKHKIASLYLAFKRWSVCTEWCKTRCTELGIGLHSPEHSLDTRVCPYWCGGTTISDKARWRISKLLDNMGRKVEMFHGSSISQWCHMCELFNHPPTHHRQDDML